MLIVTFFPSTRGDNYIICRVMRLLAANTKHLSLRFGALRHTFTQFVVLQERGERLPEYKNVQSFPGYKVRRVALISVSQPDTNLCCETSDMHEADASHDVSSMPLAFAGTHCAHPRRDGQAELVWVAGYITRWFAGPKTVTGPSTNRARCRVTSLNETNALSPRQAAADSEPINISKLASSLICSSRRI